MNPPHFRTIFSDLRIWLVWQLSQPAPLPQPLHQQSLIVLRQIDKAVGSLSALFLFLYAPPLDLPPLPDALFSEQWGRHLLYSNLDICAYYCGSLLSRNGYSVTPPHAGVKWNDHPLRAPECVGILVLLCEVCRGVDDFRGMPKSRNIMATVTCCLDVFGRHLRKRYAHVAKEIARLQAILDRRIAERDRIRDRCSNWKQNPRAHHIYAYAQRTNR